jgi:type I restriction enzyme R subunit
VALKNRVIEYFEEFQRQLKERNQELNIAMTFSFGNENDPENIPPDLIKRMFKYYSIYTGIEFVVGDKKRGESAYFEDIVERATRGGSGLNKKNIDLVIVADQLLTGYDSKKLNTLYVDRSLELQGLIQAYSRTNRIYGKEKEFGTVINFQYPRITKETVDKALKLYGSGGSSSKAIVEPYETAVQKFNICIDEMIPTLPDPSNWQSIKDDKEALDRFMLSFKDAFEKIGLLEQYYEYKWDDIAFGIDEHTWLKYHGAYKNLLRKEGKEDPITDFINPLVAKTRLAGTQVIDASHIMSLIGSKVNNVDGVQFVDGETLRIIYEQIQELSDMGEDSKANLLREFVDTELLLGKLEFGIHFDEAFDIWKDNKLKNEVNVISDVRGMDKSWLLKSVYSFNSYQPSTIPYIDEITKSISFDNASDKSAGNKLKHTMTLVRELPLMIMELKRKYE